MSIHNGKEVEHKMLQSICETELHSWYFYDNELRWCMECISNAFLVRLTTQSTLHEISLTYPQTQSHIGGGECLAGCHPLTASGPPFTQMHLNTSGLKNLGFSILLNFGT